MRWYRIDADGVENKIIIVKIFIAIIDKYNAPQGLALYNSIDKSNLYELTSYCICCPEDIAEKVVSSFTDCKVTELEPPDQITLCKLLGN